MTRFQIAAVLAAAASLVQGHFTFVRLAHNGVWQTPTRFIRNKTEPYEEATTPNTNVNTRYIIFPTYPGDYPESVRCGRDNMAHAADTESLTVKAGDTIEVAHTRLGPSDWDGWVQWDDCPDGRGSCNPSKPNKTMDFNHPGPLVAHLSKVPDGQDVNSYDGSGEWTKIFSLGLEMNEDGSIHWLAYNYQQLPGRFEFKIPEQTPAGEYLLRLDLIWPALYNPPSSPGDIAQLYPSCAQINVESPTTGDLPTGIKIPEDLRGTDVPGMRTTLSMYREESLDEGYVYPAGLLWTGEELIVDKPDV